MKSFVSALRKSIKGPFVALLMAMFLFPFLKPSFDELKPQAANAAERQPKSESTFASLLLSDSIISIIQSYYVDNARVSNRYILEILRSKLKTIKELSVADNANFLRVKHGSKEATLSKDEGVSYDDLLHFLVKAGEIVDLAEVTLEKNQRGIHLLLNMILEGMDAHSSLLSVDAYRELRQGTEGTFGGLGILVGIREGLLTVIKPLPKSPAFRNGVLRNDKILSIDKKTTYGFSLDDLVEHMRGAPGTDVEISLLRSGELGARNFSLKREVINVDSVTSRVIKFEDHEFLHAKIESFSSRTAQELDHVIKKFRKSRNGRNFGMVLDLRSNPGGLLDQAVAVSDLFLEKGVIVSTQGRHQEIENSKYGRNELDFPLAILINSDSASASEIVAGALQDHDRAFLVGQPSFGKGSVQTIFELPSERALKLTIARYYSPSGRSIQNKGINPDIWLQPVEQFEKNENLLGSYRYKNERFLANRVLAQAGYSSMAQSASKSAFKGYTKKMNDSFDDFLPLMEDNDLEMALLVLNKTNETYKKFLPKEVQRARHWLALSAPLIGKKLDQWQSGVLRFLKESHSVDWEKSNEFSEYEALHLTSPFSSPKAVFAGDTLKIPIAIHNYSKKNLSRASVFIRSNHPSFDTKETLVGKISAESKTEKTISLKIPKWWPEDTLEVELGLSVDSVPVSIGGPNFQLSLRKRDFSVISVVSSVTNEKGGKLAGYIEPLETAELQIYCLNESSVDASDLKVKLLNLTGEQIDIDTKVHRIADLKAGESLKAHFKLEGKGVLTSREMMVGLSIESDDLNEVFYQLVKLKAMPARTKILAH